ncbi:transcriptional regulator [Marinicella pacifica]|uniref:Transcriptional regulator n=1 Tax=Marinicella pacifica TaxID=1171543 RepID=A0A917CSE9_9GAMM|nr:metalloregulator ArsR/SmtB family transcription factor [Marinicella pacifica]GGF96134.1 transcriptional regulator [Marinicella pacifica]
MQEDSQQTLFQAIADTQRRKILDVLKSGEKSVAEINEHIDVSGATLSHHLSILKQADLVRVRRAGQKRIYTLNVSVLEQILIQIKKLL